MIHGWLVARPIAHRGWHSAERPENSLAAAEAAAAAGYAIECDVQISRDGEAMVFHDATLDRMTESRGALAHFPAASLGGLTLGGTDERIPTFAALLALVAGRVPVICEIKSAFAGDTILADRAAEIARGYAGEVAFKSFDPQPIEHLRNAGCTRPLGIVAQADYDDPYFAAMSATQKREASAFLHFGRTRPDFLSYCVDDLPNSLPERFHALNRPVMAWTVRTPEQWKLARQYADQAVFEGEVL